MFASASCLRRQAFAEKERARAAEQAPLDVRAVAGMTAMSAFAAPMAAEALVEMPTAPASRSQSRVNRALNRLAGRSRIQVNQLELAVATQNMKKPML
jgi:hypothetical protein